MLAIASSHLMCGFLNHAVPLHTVTAMALALCNKIPPEVTCRVTCGVRIQRLGPDLGLAKGRVNLELHE